MKPVLNTFIEWLCSKPGAENAPLMDRLRPAEGRLWVMDGLRAAEGRIYGWSWESHKKSYEPSFYLNRLPEAKVMKSHTNQAFT